MILFSLRIYSLFIALLPTIVFSQTDSPGTGGADSMHAHIDSVSSFAPRNIGAMMSASSIISSDEFLWKEYRHLGNFLAAIPGFFLYDLGSAGQPHAISLQGMHSTAIGIFLDGRPLQEPLTGQYDVQLFTTEFIERIEYIPAPQSLLYGMNSNIAAINLVSQSYNATKPYTRILYNEGAYEEGLFDGNFAQNLARNINLQLGVQRRSTDGRFENAFDDEWSVRSKIRWNVAEQLNLQLSQLYHKQKTGLFGGINPDVSTDIFDPNFAIVTDNVARQNILRWDWTLNGDGHFFDDSLATTSFALYTSSQQREFSTENILLQKTEHDFRSAWSGILLHQHFHYDQFSFEAGIHKERRTANISDTIHTLHENYFSLFGKTAMQIFSFSEFLLFGKNENYLNNNKFSLGAQLLLRTEHTDALHCGYQRKSWQFPTLLQIFNGNAIYTSYDIFSVGLQTATQRTLSGGFTFNIIESHHESPFGADSMRVDFPMDIVVHYRTEHFSAHSKAEMSNNIITGKQLSGTTEIFYRDNYFNEQLELQFGIRSNYFMFENFDSVSSINVSSWYLKGQYQNGTLDFLFFAHIGDAIVHFMWENLFDTQYFIVPFYPMPERNLRLGVTWEFLN